MTTTKNPRSAGFDPGRRAFLKAAGLTMGAGAAVVSAGRIPGPLSAADAHAAAASGPFESHYSVCDMCFNRCGLIARVKNGRVVKLDPNPHFTKSRGMLCARGQAGIAQLYDPDRLKHPLLRQGARGEGKWKRISWTEAMDILVERLGEIGEKYTRCGMLFSVGADMQSQFVHRFAEAYGSFNITSHESLCLISLNRAYLDTFGEVPFADVLNSRYVIMAGANRFEALVTPDSMDMVEAMASGAKLVVLDPRYTKTAAMAHEWWPIRPGTDMAFMLAMCHVIINERLYDDAWVAEKTFGLDELREHVRDCTPQWAAAETGIPGPDIARIARELAAAAPASLIYPGRRTSDYENSTQIRRSTAIVNALLANWDRPGGLLAARQVGLKGVPIHAPWYDDNPDDRVDAHMAPLMFEEEGSFVHTRDAVIAGEPYPVKGWFVFKTNPMQTAPDRARTMKMIEAMEFMAVADIQMSDTAWMADLVLPMPSYLERKDPCQALQGSSACACVVQRDPVVPAMYESRPIFEVMKELAGRMDLGEYFDFTIEEYRAKQLADLPGAAEVLERDGVYYNPSKVYGIYDNIGYRTRSGKIELMNQRYPQAGLDPLPVYTPPASPPQGTFRMVVGRNALVTQGSTTNNALLHELMPSNSLWMHPDAAARLGLSDGMEVRVKSAVGEGTLALKVTEAIREDTVYTDTGFGSISKGLSNVYGNGLAIAAVLESRVDAVTGNAAMHETFVTVTKAGGVS
ncbi:molybdopterin oxidoreductase [Alkalidesulfovibrio alkalitolerans DSM 16529]|uniref:Molybdopterin oxidoreductase n=1 Tax=Alkalidesulfovibrio alkalitolerans DSM 16529 TaxID=1121439 RepID=S7UGF1_9BACT|nr:molybdopterin-dependent oxidoreductase [Alkalidesulfovibrio alkalitolerans]EPR32894.1 molybdopterin oxidoreductase [Alkalidesulfovibrio alkalitolerans DSM 16529]